MSENFNGYIGLENKAFDPYRDKDGKFAKFAGIVPMAETGSDPHHEEITRGVSKDDPNLDEHLALDDGQPPVPPKPPLRAAFGDASDEPKHKTFTAADTDTNARNYIWEMHFHHGLSHHDAMEQARQKYPKTMGKRSHVIWSSSRRQINMENDRIKKPRI